jgi:hypothetical protein
MRALPGTIGLYHPLRSKPPESEPHSTMQSPRISRFKDISGFLVTFQ